MLYIVSSVGVRNSKKENSMSEHVTLHSRTDTNILSRQRNVTLLKMVIMDVGWLPVSTHLSS
jgi:hypothetical protein